MQRFPFLCYSFSLVLASLALSACSMVGHTPISKTFFDAIPGLGESVDSLKLNPNLRYLRVTVRGRVVLMVLGYIEPHPEGDINTWYSSQGEVIRLQNGRVVGTAGLETDWGAVRNFALPTWNEVLGSEAMVYRRERDEMPGYRFGIAETVSIAPVPTPFNAKLAGLPAKDFRWFEETVLEQPSGLPSARYAIYDKDGVRLVLYSDQCLSPSFCLSWQIWAAAK